MQLAVISPLVLDLAIRPTGAYENKSLNVPRSARRFPPSFETAAISINFGSLSKRAFASYAERREFLWASFGPAIEQLEALDRFPSSASIGTSLAAFDAEHVYAYWQKALDRRIADPEGAITAARSLLESTCKHVLHALGEPIDEDADLPKLWARCAEKLNLAPQQHQEKVFRSILGGCQTIVNSLGSLRNKISDAHGSAPLAVRPKPRHSELAVNLAGAMASFLVATIEARQTHAGSLAAPTTPASSSSAGERRSA